MESQLEGPVMAPCAPPPPPPPPAPPLPRPRHLHHQPLHHHLLRRRAALHLHQPLAPPLEQPGGVGGPEGGAWLLGRAAAAAVRRAHAELLGGAGGEGAEVAVPGRHQALQGPGRGARPPPRLPQLLGRRSVQRRLLR